MKRIPLRPALAALALSVFTFPHPAASALSITDSIPVTPLNVGINVTTNRLFVITTGGTLMFDGATHHQLGFFNSVSPDMDITVDEKNDRVFFTDTQAMDDPRILLFDGSGGEALKSARLEDPDEKLGRAYNPVTNRLYIADIGCISTPEKPDCKSFVAVYNGDTLEQEEWITTKRFPSSLVVDPTLNRAYVDYYLSENGMNYLTVIDGATETVLTDIPLPYPIGQLQVNPATHTLYGLDSEGRGLTVIDGLNNTVTAHYTIPAFAAPDISPTEGMKSMALNPKTGEIAFYWQHTSRSSNFTDDRIYLWKGDVNANGDLSFAENLVLARPVWRGLEYKIPGIWFNPTMDRLYVDYGMYYEPTRSLISVEEDGFSHLSGDVDDSGAVDVADVVETLRIIVSGTPPTPEQIIRGDVDANGALNVKDAVGILRKVVGL